MSNPWDNYFNQSPDVFANKIKNLEQKAGRKYGGPPPAGSQSHVKIQEAKEKFAQFKNLHNLRGTAIHDNSPNKLPGEI
jgi:ABC-type proline/glycine betaine transport system substrate-binding protein|tara:strand:- start:1020 stop:1256 length:237 start_codon:yes stop_codon:yes gene_type:complete